MKITGKIKMIGETEQVSDKFKKRELVVTTYDNPTYPQQISMQCTNDKVVMLDNLSVGQEVSIEANLRGREWTSPTGQIKYFNTIECWKLDIIGEAVKPAATVPDDFEHLPF
jgi:single-strand DNA-binding protein